MFFDAATTAPDTHYRLLTGGVTPRPIAWISTVSADGTPNLAPYSFFTVASCAPPVLVYAQSTPRTGQDKDTLANLQATQCAVVNIVSAAMAEAMNATSAPWPHGTSEFEAAGIAACASTHVPVPGVAGSAVRYECRLREVVRVSMAPAGGTLVLLDVVGTHVDDALWREGAIDAAALDSIGRLGGEAYARTRDRFHLARPTLPSAG